MHRAKRRLDPVIETARLRLRPIRETDLDDIVAGVADLAVARWLARVPHPYRMSDAEAFVATSRQAAREGRSLVLAIEHAGRLVGVISLEAIPTACELGYWIARPQWGRGFASEAGAAILAYGFAEIGLKRVRSGYFAGNEGSRRVQHRLGFYPIGRGLRRSLAQGAAVEHIDTVLTPARFRRANQ